MLTQLAESEKLAEVLRGLGGLSPERVRLHPTPGEATEDDVTRIESSDDRLFELVDGVLVEKTGDIGQSLLAASLASSLLSYVDGKDLGVVLGGVAALRLRPGLVRIPDVSFISWDQMPSGEFPSQLIPDLYPDLAVEVLSDSNTAAEMERKLAEYFEAGCRLVWIVDPKTHTADIYTSPTDCQHLRASQSLDGGDVLPGFKLPLKELFASTRRRRR